MSNFSLTPDLAAQIAQRDPVLGKNTEQGFTNTYGPGTNIPDGQLGFAVPALGVSALGLYLLYQKHQQDKKDREQAQEKVALTWQDVRAQLPGFHAPDILLGGAAGAGAGMLYDYIRGGEKGKRFNQALRRILTGAAIGAGLTNLVGDRARRYITNSVVPAGYDSGNILSQLKPRSFQHVWDAAIKDKPSYDPAAEQKFVQKFRNTEVGQRVLAARREIERIAQGVDTHSPGSSVWQRNQDKTYSLNEKNKNYLRNLASIMFPTQIPPNRLAMFGELENLPPNHQTIAPLFINPTQSLEMFNKGIPGTKVDPFALQVETDLFGTNPLLGAQQLIAKQNGRDVDALVLDRHDITPSAAQVTALRDAITSGKVLDSKWRGQVVTQNSYERGQTNAQTMTGTLGRLFWDRILRQENPWISQKIKFTPVTGPSNQPEYGLQPLRQDNSPVFTQPLNRRDLFEYLQQLQGGATIPELK